MADARNSVTPFSRNGGPRVTCSVQPTGRSTPDRFSTLSLTRTDTAGEPDPPLDPQVRQRQQRPLDEGLARLLELVPHERRLAVHGQPGRGLLVRRPAEDVEAQVVAHDPREQRRVDSAAILGVHGVVVGRRLDRRPRRRPERVDARGLVQDLGDVAAFL